MFVYLIVRLQKEFGRKISVLNPLFSITVASKNYDVVCGGREGGLAPWAEPLQGALGVREWWGIYERVKP